MTAGSQQNVGTLSSIS